MNLKLTVKDFIAKEKLLATTDKLLVTVSGGIDSMVLLHLLFELGYNCEVAHCNFNLRGEEADKDQELVRDFCKSLDIPIHVISFQTEQYSKEHGISIQMAARDLRYNWFNELIVETDLDKVITAHHLDDNVETVLLNLIRGTGIKGLTGIASNSNNIVRPLLNVDKKAIKMYANTHEVQFREDQSNHDIKYKRNFVRNELLPLVQQMNSNFSTTLATEILKYKESYAIEENYLHENALKVKDGVIDLIFLNSSKAPHLLLHDALKDFGFNMAQVTDILNDTKTSGRRFQSNTHEILINREQIEIRLLGNENDVIHKLVIDESDFNGKIGSISIDSKRVLDSDVAYGNEKEGYFDLSKIDFPLTLRKWEPGDSFKPLGMNGMMKISDFLINKKLSVFEKEKVYLLLSNNNDVLWVLGMRISEDYKLTKDCKSVLKVSTQVSDD